MNVVFTMNLPYFPAHGGASRSNRYMLGSLAARGHRVSAVVPLRGVPARQSEEEVRAEIRRGAAPVTTDSAGIRFEMDGVSVHAVADAGRLSARLADEIGRVRPDWIFVSCEDPSQTLLRTAVQVGGTARIAYLARTTSFLPFGPQAFFASHTRARLLSQVHVILTVSQYVADYVRQWTGLPARAAPLQFFGSPPFPRVGRWDRGYVTMVNPCAVKGLALFLRLADERPDIAFAAVPTWGTNAAEFDALRARPNVTLLPASESIDEILAVTKVLVVPSIWGEAKSRVITEAMLRGVPVLASDSGGNREAKLGTDYVLPVRLIQRFGDDVDENMLPVPVVPEQDVSPWLAALVDLLGDRDLYERHAAAACEAASAFVMSQTPAALEQMLLAHQSAPRLGPLEGARLQADAARSAAGTAVMTPAQLALLTLRLRSRPQ